MAVNADPYQTLGLKADATDAEIGSAYRRRALRYHPDKNPNNPKAREEFDKVAVAYSALINKEDAKSKDSSSGVPVDADALFKNTRKDGDDQIDPDEEMEELKLYWEEMGGRELPVKDMLRVSSDQYVDQLQEVYTQARFVFPTDDNDQHGKTATKMIHDFVKKHFGEANVQRLKEWDGKSPLDPFADDQYIEKDGTLVKASAEPPKIGVPQVITTTHLQADAHFEYLLRAEDSKQIATALKELQRSHKLHYEKAWKDLQTTAGSREKEAMAMYTKTMDWEGVHNSLSELRTAAKSDNHTKYSTAKLAWDNDVRNFGFPASWDRSVAELTKVKTKYTQSVVNKPGMKATVSEENEEGQAVDTSTPSEAVTLENGTKFSIMDIDGMEKRVHGYLPVGWGNQFVVEIAADPIVICDLVACGKRKGELILYQESGGRNLRDLISDKPDLSRKRFADMNIVAIAAQRRDDRKEPVSGWQRRHKQYVFVQWTGETEYRIYTRSALCKAFGDDMIDAKLKRVREEGEVKPLPEPNQPTLAIMYRTGQGDLLERDDTSSEDDYNEDTPDPDLKAWLTPHPEDVSKLPPDGESEVKSFTGKALQKLSKNIRMPAGPKQPQGRGGKKAITRTPQTDEEADEIIALMQAYKEQLKIKSKTPQNEKEGRGGDGRKPPPAEADEADEAEESKMDVTTS